MITIEQVKASKNRFYLLYISEEFNYSQQHTTLENSLYLKECKEHYIATIKTVAANCSSHVLRKRSASALSSQTYPSSIASAQTNLSSCRSISTHTTPSSCTYTSNPSLHGGEEFIRFTKTLDFNVRPRINLSGGGHIEVHTKQIHVSEPLKWYMVCSVYHLGGGFIGGIRPVRAVRSGRTANLL